MLASRANLTTVVVLSIFGFAVAAMISLMTQPKKQSLSTIEFVGQIVPFALFGAISSYYFVTWALRHPKLAVMITASLFVAAYAYLALLAPPTGEVTTLAGGRLNETTAVRYMFGNRTDVVLGTNPVIPSSARFQPPSPTLAAIIIVIVEVAVIAWVLLHSLLLRRLGQTAQLPLFFSSSVEDFESQSDFGDEIRRAIIHYYRSALQSIRRRGMSVKISDTPRVLVYSVCSKLPEVCSGFRDLTSLLEEARFSLHHMTNEHRQRAAQAFANLTDSRA